MSNTNVDNTKQFRPRLLSLCSGYGGLEIGLREIFGDVRVVTYVEIEAFAIANLVSKMEAGKMDSAPVWTDLKTFPLECFPEGTIDIITGGYPCQPFSIAGKQKGRADDRHLFPYIAKIIRHSKPKICVFENVRNHIRLGLGEVLAELRSLGYRVRAGIFSAEEVGAPHRRERVFIVGVLEKPTGLGWSRWRNGDDRRSREIQTEGSRSGVSNTSNEGFSRTGNEPQSEKQERQFGHNDTKRRDEELEHTASLTERKSNYATGSEPRQDTRAMSGGRRPDVSNTTGTGLQNSQREGNRTSSTTQGQPISEFECSGSDAKLEHSDGGRRKPVSEFKEFEGGEESAFTDAVSAGSTGYVDDTESEGLSRESHGGLHGRFSYGSRKPGQNGFPARPVRMGSPENQRRKVESRLG